MASRFARPICNRPSADYMLPNPWAVGPRSGRAVRHSLSRYDWEQLPPDPDLEHDFGYDVAEWDSFRTGDKETGYLMFLPRDPGMLADDAFVVAHERMVCDLEFYA